MPIVRQLPALYLRGSIANVTMANLSDEDVQNCERIAQYVANHPSMTKHRTKVVQELRETIGGDYRDATSLGRQSAEQEYLIAVWRGVVNLFYHRHYTFKCGHCGSSEYMTQRGKPKAIDRVQIPCPNCQHVKVSKSGPTALVVGSYVTLEEFQTACQNTEEAECESSIEVTAGELRYNNSQEIIDDVDQMTKFFGEFVWNYFRQQLRENSRVEHGKVPQRIVGRADEIIVEEICSLCAKMHVAYNYCSKTQPENDVYRIQIAGLQTPPEFTAELVPILHKAAQNNVRIDITDIDIRVHQAIESATIEAYIVRPEHVMMLDDAPTSDEAGFTIDHVSFKTIGTQRMYQDDHVAQVEYSDVMDAVLEALPDGNCRKIFDLCRQDGDLFEDFSRTYGSGLPKQTHMAEYLGITTRSVKQYMETIRVTCLASDLIPD